MRPTHSPDINQCGSPSKPKQLHDCNEVPQSKRQNILDKSHSDHEKLMDYYFFFPQCIYILCYPENTSNMHVLHVIHAHTP